MSKGGARALKTITVDCPEWSDVPVVMREIRVKDYLAAMKIVDEEERSVFLLGATVLGPDDKPVGVEVIMEAPVTVLMALALHVPRLLGQGEPPLESKSASDTA
jgi:hypothetical protein